MSRGAHGTVEAEFAADGEVELEAVDGGELNGEPIENPVATEDIMEAENEVITGVVGSGGTTNVPETTTARGPTAQPSSHI